MSELLFYNGNVMPLTSTGARAFAVLVRYNRVAYVGSEVEARRQVSPGAQMVDLAGRTLIPGFNDNHIHLVATGAHAATPNLFGMSKSEILEFLRGEWDGAQPGEWLFAGPWDYPHCPDPHREDLDRVFPNNPVVLRQFSGHAIWANSEAFRRVGISAKTEDWASGGLVRDADGNPTGVVREPFGYRPFRKVFQRRTRDRKYNDDSITEAMRMLNACGVTSVQDNTWYPVTLESILGFLRRGELTIRVNCWAVGRSKRDVELMDLHRYDYDWVSRGPVKYFLDGAFSSRTAWLTEPYLSEPENSGKGVPAVESRKYVEYALAHRRQIASHSIGDRATREYCDAIEAIGRDHPDLGRRLAELRPRIEHGQLIRPADIERIAKLGILVSAQPHAAGDVHKDIELLGAERAKRAYPYRSLLDAGASLSFGSDFPGERSYPPLEGIQYAVDRDSGERITVEEALRCYTAGSAFAEFREELKGTIEVGKLADLAVLAKDPTVVDPSRIRDIDVDLTIVDGRVVFDRRTRHPGP